MARDPGQVVSHFVGARLTLRIQFLIATRGGRQLKTFPPQQLSLYRQHSLPNVIDSTTKIEVLVTASTLILRDT
ncbi:hypothetical protein EVAR_30908_1 [Eumeta japonica]|uniref:Uncharacterized protein n=1 Tax=Eumeta variegata TaxID=151549 RepID=A0A4C1V460_EUMVA|nr:hypothetical protein EVAR_30908_1 [Eumeta japonica]